MEASRVVRYPDGEERAELAALLSQAVTLLRSVASDPRDTRFAVAEPRYSFAGVEVDLSRRHLTRAGREVHLAPREFDLLLALLRRDGAVATRDELLREVWDGRISPSSRTLDKHIFKLRHKLEVNPEYPAIIRTVAGIGYRLEIGDSSP